MLDRRLLLLSSAAALLHPSLGLAAAEDFASWVKTLRKDALGEGVRPQVFDAAFRGVQPLDKILELDRKQPEFTLTFEQYQARVVNEARIERGRQLLRENRPLLDQAAAQFGVPPRYVVALWGIETDFGRLTGGYKVVQALATLAYDGRRAAFFRRELLNALKILDKNQIDPDQMLGSWAGAMGQSQFMPSSYLAYAVDFDGDGRRDIWNSRPDVFGSIANYLSKSGWRMPERWGVRVAPPANFDPVTLDQKIARSPQEWEQLGFVRLDGSIAGHEPEKSASILLPGGPEGPAYMVFENFKVILKWNRSNYFAVAVGTLADRIGEG